MLFADDSAVAAHSPSKLKCLIDRYVNPYTDFRITISHKKSKVLAPKIYRQIGKPATIIAHHRTLVWKNPRLTIKTKVAVYNACVLSTLLYGIESWKTYAAHY